MKVITFQDIARMEIAPKICFEWVQTVIEHKKEAMLPPKISLKPRDGVFCNVMPSIIFGTPENSCGGG